MLNTRNKDKNTVFYSYLACGMDAFPSNMYESPSYTGFTRRNTLFIFVWLSQEYVNIYSTRRESTLAPNPGPKPTQKPAFYPSPKP